MSLIQFLRCFFDHLKIVFKRNKKLNLKISESPFPCPFLYSCSDTYVLRSVLCFPTLWILTDIMILIWEKGKIQALNTSFLNVYMETENKTRKKRTFSKIQIKSFLLWYSGFLRTHGAKVPKKKIHN